MTHLIEVAHTWDGAPIEAGERVQLRLRATGEDLQVTVHAPYHGDPAPPSAPGPTDALWRHEVVELFIAHGERYLELEIGPHGHHLVLQLDGIRQITASGLPLALETHIEGPRWQAHLLIPAAWLPPEPWTANAYALHGQGETRRYLAAWPVPGPQPDFHRLHCFRPLPRPAG